MKKMDYHDGKHYYNPHMRNRRIRDVLHWLWKRRPRLWSHMHTTSQKVAHQRVAPGKLWVTFINHSTVLIQLNNWNILTDPIWSERASPFSRVGPKRVISPGVRFEDLPHIDFVFISHNHYDHMDIPTLKRLKEAFNPTFYVTKGNRAFLRKKDFKKVEELDWWESLSLSKDYLLTCVPAQHFSGRSLLDQNKTLWGGFVLKGATDHVYFAGDSGYGPHFKEISERLGPSTLSILPIGVFKPEWFMKPVHMSPAGAVQAHLDLQSQQSMGIHFGTFQLGDEEYDAPSNYLRLELQKHHLSNDVFWVLKPGEGREVLSNNLKKEIL